MSVSTAVVSTRSLRPRVTFKRRANWTTRSLSCWRVSGPIVLARADQGGVVGDLLQIHTAELAEHQAVVDEELGLGVAPAVEPHHHEHPEEDLHGGGMAAVDAGQGISAAQVGAEAGDDLVVVEQAIELSQLGLELQLQLRDQGEPVDGFVAVAEHGGSLPNVASGTTSGTLLSLPNAEKAVHFAPQTSSTAERI
jgi:hypothetical protein